MPRALDRNDIVRIIESFARSAQLALAAGFDGIEIHGFLVNPLDPPAPGMKPPALLRPHGGPQSQYACEFSFEAQLFAANGYTVVMPNPSRPRGAGLPVLSLIWVIDSFMRYA